MLEFRIRRRFLPALLALTLGGFPDAWAGDVAKTTRLVSIGGAVTEIIFALGEEQHLVARDTTSVYPPEATALPDIGYMRALSPEGILSVNPTAIVMIEGSGPRETVDVLSRAAIPMIVIPDHFSRDGIVAKILAVGRFVAAEEKAEALAKAVAADIDAASKVADAVPPSARKRVLFVLSMQSGKVMASGEGTAAAAIIALAGGINALSGFHGYKPVSDEAIIAAKPDVILMMNNGGGRPIGDGELLAQPAIGLTPAAKTRAVIRMDGLTLLGFGPRTGQAIRALTGALYGG